MKGGHKEGTQNNEKGKSTLLHIRHFQKYDNIPGNVRKSNLKCGNNFVLDAFVHGVFLSR